MKKVFFFFIHLMIWYQIGFGQSRYSDAIFAVKKTSDVVYGTNIGIITGAVVPENLLMDVYEPVGDTKTDRPLILIAHTGNFLPQFYNGQINGSRSDSTVVYTANYYTSRGYVVAAFTYRLGWLRTSTDQNARTGTFLHATYRAIQDTRTCIRYFKKSVAENNNPYGIDPGKICVWGIGTGGNLAMGAGSLNDFSEVELPGFINSNTLWPFVDSTILGNLYATDKADLCLPNHPGYSSVFQFSFSMGGSIMDSTWLDGEDGEPAYSGVHCTNDFWSPYYSGQVIIPTSNDFVYHATGTRRVIEQANLNGSNKILENVNAAHDPLASLITSQKNTVGPIFPSNKPNVINIGTDNFYGFDIPLIINNQVIPQGTPWEWWNLDTLRAIVTVFNFRYTTTYNADTLHRYGLMTNPLMSAQRGKAYLDTVFALATPRLCAALNLGCSNVTTKDINDHEVGLGFGPNPFRECINFSTNEQNPISDIYVYDLNGRLVKANTEINASQFIMQRYALKAGFYFAQIRMKDKMATRQIIVTD